MVSNMTPTTSHLRLRGMAFGLCATPEVESVSVPVALEPVIETEWYGMIGMTGDHLPRLHRFGPQAIGFCGYNGRGISPGTVFGRMLAEHILGRREEAEMPLPVTEFETAPFQGLREAYYEYGAQIAHVAGARF